MRFLTVHQYKKIKMKNNSQFVSLIKMKKIVSSNRSAQVWIETVIYTLIGLAIIGVLLSIVKPAIDEKKDQILIDKSLTMIETIHSKVEEVIHYGTGNSRLVEIQLTKGRIEVKPADNSIEFYMDSTYMYSELGQNVSVGKVVATTAKKGKVYEVKLILSYNDLVLTWNGKNATQVFQPSPGPYKITITNNGTTNGITQVNFS